MHAEAWDFVRRVAQSLPPIHTVVEFGSRIVNGSVREIFTDQKVWVGIDLVAGEGVDWVGDVTEYQSPFQFDAVVCCEMLEHAPNPAKVFEAAFRLLRPGGVLILTCAGFGREAHSCDGGEWNDDEPYNYIDHHNIKDWAKSAGFSTWPIEYRNMFSDLYALCFKYR